MYILRPDIMRRLDFGGIFGNSRPVELELGAGDGGFMARYAGAHPELNLIAVERLLGRLRKIDRKARRGGLTNIRCLRLEASYVLDWMIPAGSLSAIHLYFPDPWPKRRHWKNRLVNDAFAVSASRALRPGGVFYARTDDAPYFEQIRAVFDAASARGDVAEVTVPPELLAVTTDFEAAFHAEGKGTLYAAWRRTDRALPPVERRTGAVLVPEADTGAPLGA